MHAILNADAALVAPTVGTWRPRVGRGAPLSAGLLLGHLWRAGREVPVYAPEGVAGVARTVTAAGAWVAFGDPVVAIGAAIGEGVDAIVTAPRDADVPEGVHVVRAETDGTIYLRPEPGAPAFAPLAATVSAHQTVALIEVMKTFNPVRAAIGGTVERVLVAEAGAVSAGDPLLWLRASTEPA